MTNPVSDTLNKLRSQFIDRLPEKLDAIRSHFQLIDPAAWQPVEVEVLHRLLHSLTGSAGTFGLQPVSIAARVLESRISALLKARAIPTATEWQVMSAELEQLLNIANTQLASDTPSLTQPPPAARPDRSPLIHLVEDDPAQAAHLGQALQDDGYRVRIFTHPDEFRTACTAVDEERPAAVIMDMIFPEGDNLGAVMLGELKAKHTRCPPVIIASVRDDLPARLAAFRAGASRYLVKPLQTRYLTDLLDELTNRQPAQPYRILMVDDDPQVVEAQAELLRTSGMEVVTLTQPLMILELLNDFTPDVAVLDMYMPDASGAELAAILRERDAQMHLPILFLSSETDMTRQLLALNLGGDDFLVKPVQPDHLVAAVTARARRARQNNVIQKRLETTLYEREREHQTLNQHAIVSIADRAGNINYVNDKFCKISGYSAEELMGHNHRILKSGVHPAEFYQDLWRTIASGKVWQGEVCNRRKDGSLYWVESTITPFLDSGGDGKPYQYVSIRTDISHMKAAQTALRTGEERLKQAQQVAHLGSFEWNTVSGELNWSDEHYRLWGYQPNSVTPSFELFRQGIYPDDLIRLDAALQRAMEKNELFDIAYRLQRPDGSTHFMHSRGEFTFDAAGKAIKLTGTVQDMTALKLAEQALMEKQKSLNLALDASHAGFFVLDLLEGRAEWDDRAYGVYGQSKALFEPSFENLSAVVIAEDQVMFTRFSALLQTDATDWHEIYRVKAANGAIRTIEGYGYIMRAADNSPLKVIGTVVDISERKLIEQEVESSKERLRRGQLFANIGTWEWNIQSGELFWTERIAPLFGYPVAELETSYANFLAAIHPDDRQSVIDAVNACVERDAPYEIEHRVVWPDGTVRWLLERGAVVRDEDGKPLQMLGVVQDIDDRKHAEMALAERDRFMKSLIDIMPGMIGYWSADLRCTFANIGYKKWFGKTPEQMIGISMPELLGAELFHKNEPFIQAALRGETQTFERTMTKADGDTGYTWAHYIPDFNNGKVHGFFVMVSDISEIKISQIRLEELNVALTSARDEADRANQAKSEFLSSMSHELRTPMNAILGFGQLLQYDTTLSAEQKDSVAEIIRAGEHLLALINEVLDLSKVESGHIDMSLETVELRPVVEECLGLVITLADKRSIQISDSVPKGIAVRADRTRLLQVLLNLLSNAIKYNREGGSVKIEMQIEAADRLRILVRDSGQGIATARLAELFLPFSRLDAENSGIEGTGIGLTITRRIVEMMGGSVDVKSEVGVGSTFWIELPLVSMGDATQQQHPAEVAADSGTLSQHADAEHTVLYIEDNPANLRLVAQIIGRRKHIHLLTAHTAELGIELALARRPELILLDINMPGMDGYQVLEVFKAEASLRNIPVVAVTANAMTRDIERGMAAGFTEYLTKPLDVARFHSVLDKLLVTDIAGGAKI